MSKDQSDDYVCVKLSAQCVQEQNLMSFVNFSGSNTEAQKVVPVVIQFQLDRINFVYQHHAVDNLSCMTVLFPPYPQENKYVICSISNKDIWTGVNCFRAFFIKSLF